MPARPAQTMTRWVAPSNPTNLTVQAEKTMPNRKKIISPANHMIWLGEQNSLDLYLLNQERAQQFTLQELQGPQAKVCGGNDEEEENPLGYMSQLIGDVGIVYVNGTLVTEYDWYNRYLNQVSYDEIRSASVDLVRSEEH